MKIKLYNTPKRKLEEFKPIKDGQVGVYSCGPTVYWNQHIGHMYAYIQWDVLVRFFRFLGFKVKWVMNITDVGHMTSDEDVGEDKMAIGAKREGLSVWQVAEKYTNQFLTSLALLNVQKPDVLARATEHIPEQIELVRKIEANGFAYRTKTGLVFDTSKFKEYGQFAGLDLEKQEPGARLEVDPEKKQPWDFLLWVTNQPKHVMQWDSPWGRGFPGWHLECTAMSVKYLGEKFDIHTGGSEHIPVHHTNEVAQAYGAFGQPTANYWLHNAWLVVKREKMSKSLGNMYLATDLVEKGFDPLHFRYLVLTSHYRKGLNFTWKSLEAAAAALDKLRETTQTLKRQQKENATLTEESEIKRKKYREKFLQVFGTDLNAPQALGVVWEVIKSSLTAYDKYELLMDFDQVLGLELDRPIEKKIKIPLKIEKLAKNREAFRQAKKWREADQVRQQVAEEGWLIEDRPQGPEIKPKKVFDRNKKKVI